MKELTIEQKAKAYDEALERAREWSETKNGYYTPKELCEEIFPELKESEDEKIREEITEFFKKASGGFLDATTHCKTFGKWLAWLEKQGENKDKNRLIWKHWSNGIAGNGDGEPIYLIKHYNTYSVSSCLSFECDYIELSELDNLMLEKQGEQKTADNVEPKFKAGDWIISKYMHLVMQILNNDNGSYKTVETDGTERNDSYDFIERNFKLWTIQDAKDGDVLCAKYGNDEMPFIFTGKQDDVAYCALNSFGEFVLSIAEWLLKTSVLPATKEQHKLLFQKMKEAGYEWDAKKKELKKISSWSEEDDYNLQCIIAKIVSDIQNGNVGRNYELINWLKALKPQNT